MLKNYQNETLTTTIGGDVLNQQLQDLLDQEKVYLILPSALEFELYGFENCLTFTADQFLERRLKEYQDEATWDEETAKLDFYEWLELDAQVYDSLYCLVEDLINGF